MLPIKAKLPHRLFADGVKICMKVPIDPRLPKKLNGKKFKKTRILRRRARFQKDVKSTAEGEDSDGKKTRRPLIVVSVAGEKLIFTFHHSIICHCSLIKKCLAPN